MDHISSIFTLHPKLPLEHNLQATFHHIFRLDPLHTFELNHTSSTDSSNTTEKIRPFMLHSSANPRFNTRFPFTDTAYIRASIQINLRIHLFILQGRYALSLYQTRVYTRFRCSELAYTSLVIIEQHTSSAQIFSSDLTLLLQTDVRLISDLIIP